jgi:hypothetical protein
MFLKLVYLFIKVMHFDITSDCCPLVHNIVECRGHLPNLQRKLLSPPTDRDVETTSFVEKSVIKRIITRFY